MVDNYCEMLHNIRANIKTSIVEMQKPAILQVIDTIIGTKANQASSSGINAPAGQSADGSMQVG